MLVSIITPVTGNPLMLQAIQSVQDQDYENIEHLIVIDGQEREAVAREILQEVEFKKKQTHVLCLPYATGKDRFNGHRIYAFGCYLINGDFVSFLDEDNWFDHSHISTLAEVVYHQQLDWAYSLRKIVNPEGDFISNDDCESLGKWMAFNDRYAHVDTSCYLLRKEIAIAHTPIWYRKFRDPGVMSPDMALCNHLIQNFPNCNTTGLYSVNYRVGSGSLTVKPEFFLEGNSVMKKRYAEGLPWCNQDLSVDYLEKLYQELPLRKHNFIACPAWTQDGGVLESDLSKLFQGLLKYPNHQDITLLLAVSSENQENASAIVWDVLLLFSEWLEKDLTELPEIYLLSEISPMRHQILLEQLEGYITLPNEDLGQRDYWIVDQFVPLNTDSLGKS
jgi:hypothetical protein